MKSTHRLVAASLPLWIGCGDFTPVQTALVHGGDGGLGGGLNGCTAEQFVDRSAADADRTLGFGGEHGSGGFSFSPRCLTIAAGQDVTWMGAFSTHPLNPGVPGNARGGDPGNPIPVTSTGTSVTVSFPRPGTYPFVCGMHAFLGMTGVVVVR